MTTSINSFRATWAISLIVISLFCCPVGFSAGPQDNDHALQVFLTRTLHGQVQVLAHKESRPPTSGKAHVSAILCGAKSRGIVLLIAEVRDHHFRKVWSSLNAVKTPGVISPRNLEYVTAKEGEYFTFWGCNPHDCGGVSGTYIFDVFDISKRSMLVLDVRRCASTGVPSNPARVRMCVTNLIDENAQIPPSIQNVVSKQIRSDIEGAENVPVQF